MKKLFLVMTVCLLAIGGQAQTYNQIDENGTIIQRDEFGNQTNNQNLTSTIRIPYAIRRYPKVSMCGR